MPKKDNYWNGHENTENEVDVMFATHPFAPHTRNYLMATRREQVEIDVGILKIGSILILILSIPLIILGGWFGFATLFISSICFMVYRSTKRYYQKLGVIK